MTEPGSGHPSASRESWEEEIVAAHRWGRFAFWFKTESQDGERELARLRELWESAQPLNSLSRKIVEQTQALEICNYRLEESILSLCAAIGKNQPSQSPIGHMASVSDERWKKVWAYFFALKAWLPSQAPDGYNTLLSICDPQGEIEKRLWGFLGDKTSLKELYVERFSLCLQRWLSGNPVDGSAQTQSHMASVSLLEDEIRKQDPERRVVPEVILQDDGEGRLQPCNHKAFRRYDLIISSIGALKWRATMPRRGTDGIERARVLNQYLSPIESWLEGLHGEPNHEGTGRKIHSSLGPPNPTKRFLAAFLVSVLRPQELAARKLAETRTAESR